MAEARKIRTLCILLVLRAVVSYRSVTRILKLFDEAGWHPLGWIPHFTSTINWTLRTGLGLLKQVGPIDQPWVAIIDHSIDIGTKKALVVLRVPMDTVSTKNRAICLEDCECVGLSIAEEVNGASIARELKAVFDRAGAPVAVLKDCDRTLHKGVRLWSEGQDKAVPTIEDVGHVMASALKAQFEDTAQFKDFTSLANKGAKNLRQTNLAFLIPPKLRTKGRFQSIGKLADWGKKILAVLEGENKRHVDSLDRLHAAFPNFDQSKQFIKHFASTTQVISRVMEMLKNKGLDQTSCDHCHKLTEQLPKDSKTKQRLSSWLQQHLAIQKKIASGSLLVSSDIIESLFGSFKHIMERSPQADMNRTTLLIPALCGIQDDKTIAHALHMANHRDLQKWEKDNVPYTMRKKRQEFLGNVKSINRGNYVGHMEEISTA